VKFVDSGSTENARVVHGKSWRGEVRKIGPKRKGEVLI